MNKLLTLMASVILACAPATLAAGDSQTAEKLDRALREIESLKQELAKLKADRARQTAEAMSARMASIEAELAKLVEEIGAIKEEVETTADSVDAIDEANQQKTNVTVYGALNAMDYQGLDSVLDGQAFELVFSGKPHKRLGFFSELEFERAAAVGGQRGGEVVVEQAYANYQMSDLFNLRAGILLVPFGNVNIDHYAPARDTISKPIVSYVVAPSDWTDNGLGLYGRRLLGESWLFQYETYVIAGLGADITALGARDARQPFGVDNNGDKALVGRYAFSYLDRFTLGLSGYSGKYDDASRHRLTGYALDTLVKAGPFVVTGEYNDFRGGTDAGTDLSLSGYYARIVYNFGNSFLSKGRHGEAFPDAYFQLVAQYDNVSVEGPLGEASLRNDESRTTFGFNYRPSHEWVLKLNYESNKAKNLDLMRGTITGWLLSIGFVF